MSEVKVSKTRYQRLKEHAEQTGNTMEQVFEQALEQFLTKVEEGSIIL